MKLPLTLHYAGEMRHEPVAWFLPGDDPAQWLPEIASWNPDQQRARVRLVPHSLRDRRTCGVLVTPGGPVARPAGSAGVAYGCLAGRCYLPADAELAPALTPRELEALLAAGREYVFHPVAGLVGFDPHELHRLTDLWEKPASRALQTGAARWNLAQPGTAFHQRLISVLPLEAPSADDILASGGGDIGQKQERGLQPDPQAGEPASGPLGAAGRAMLGGVAGGLNWMAGMVPDSWTPEFLRKSADWAAEKLNQLGIANEFLRNKEISRLLKLLADNPDEGLKYALPLANDHAGRGIGAANNRLFTQNLDFRIGGFGGPVDPWQIDAQRQAALHASYRELAARELNLGRYRRAAYIYAHLLGDFAAAAAALRSGQHWREAATLYLEKLRQPAVAAECLIAGGLFSEAIPILEELRKFEQVGELYQRLGEEELARAAFRQEVERVKTGGDFLAAAVLLEKRLGEPEEALELLAQGWPHSAQAEICLHSLWLRLDQVGRRDDLLRRMKAVRDQSLTTQQCLARVKTLAQFATRSADAAVQACAADAVRIIAARKLPAAEPHYVRQMLLALRGLAQGDKLLERDTIRYLRSRLATPAPEKPASPKPAARTKLVRRITLPTKQPADWFAAVVHGEVIYAFGGQSDEKWCQFVCARTTWDGRYEIHRQDWIDVVFVEPILALSDEVSPRLFLWSPESDFAPGELQLHFAQTDIFPEISIANYPANQRRCLGIAAGNGQFVAISFGQTGWALYSTQQQGHTFHTAAVPQPKSKTRTPLPMVVRRETFTGWGTELLKGKKVIADFGRQITSLSAAPARSRSRLAIGFETGGVVYWDNSADNRRTLPFAAGLSDFITCFTRNGHLVAAGEQGGEVYDTRDCQLRFVRKIDPPGARVIALLPGTVGNQFALVLADGTILVYEV